MDRAAGRPGRRGSRAGRREGRGAAPAGAARRPGAGRVRGQHGGVHRRPRRVQPGPDRGAAPRPAAGRRRRPSWSRPRPRPGPRCWTRRSTARCWTRCAPPTLERGLGEVAVRSSAAAEDAADSSYAGEHDSYLELHGPDAVAEAVRRCWASLYTARAVSYRGERDAGRDGRGRAADGAGPRGRGVHDPEPGQRRPLHAGLRGRLGPRRAAGLRRGHPGPVRAGQGQRRGAAPGDRRQADPAGPRARRRHGHRGRPASRCARPPA